MGSRGVRTSRTEYVGRVLGFFESFPFFQLGRWLWGFVGPVAQHVFAFYGDFSPLIRVPLIMVPDSSPDPLVESGDSAKEYFGDFTP